MYKIIGADQKEYGPVSVDQLRQWVAEGRINAQTPVQAEGETTWKPISMVPEFAASFASAPPAYSTPPAMGTAAFPGYGRERALQDVSGPAIGLMITAGLGIFCALAGIAMSVLGIGMGGMYGNTGIVLRVIGIAVCIFILYGAVKMKKLESHGMAVAASILAMIPCLSPCCIVGLPIGIWALVILNKTEVKDSFS
jgi:hypothetical protein